MKFKPIRTISGSVALLTLFLFSPMAYSASLKSDPIIQFNSNGSVIATEAEVMAVYGNYIEARTDIDNTINSPGAYWQITTIATSSANIGDRIAFEGHVKQFGRWSDIVVENATVFPSADADSKPRNFGQNRSNKDVPVALFYRDGSVEIPKAEVKVVNETIVEARSPLSNGMYWIAKTDATSSVRVGDMVSISAQLETFSRWGTIFLKDATLSRPNNINDRGLKNGWLEKEDRDNRGQHKGFLKGATSTDDLIAPGISSIVITPGTTTATVEWDTSEPADSAVFFSASLPVDTSNTATQVASSGAKVMNHSVTLSNLTASTTYFIVIQSRDAAGNTSVRFGNSFTTGTENDTIVPEISSIIWTTGTSTVRISWNTNELTTSKMFYSTTTPVNINSSSTPFIEDTTLVNAHDLTLTGLHASTTYYIVVQSRDAADNVASASQFPVLTSQ